MVTGAEPSATAEICLCRRGAVRFSLDVTALSVDDLSAEAMKALVVQLLGKVTGPA
jgi:hypothetical protein